MRLQKTTRVLHQSQAVGPRLVTKARPLPAKHKGIRLLEQPSTEGTQEKMMTNLATDSISSTTLISGTRWRISIQGTGQWIN